MKKTFLNSTLAMLSLFALSACTPANNSSSNSSQNNNSSSTTKISENSSTGENVTSVQVSESDITLVEEESVYIEATALPSSASQEFVFSSANPNVATVDPMGEIVAIEEGSTTIKVAHAVKEDVFAEINVTVTDAFFSRSLSTGYSEYDMTMEMDSENPHVVYNGQDYLMYKDCYGTRWYAYSTFSITSFAVGEKYAKVGMYSLDETKQNGMFYFFDAPLGDNDSLIDFWNQVGYQDMYMGNIDTGEYNNWTLLGQMSRDILQPREGEPCLRYGDEFQMGLLRDGAYYHFYFNGYYINSVKSNLFDPEAPTYAAITGNKTNMTVSDYGYITDEAKINEMVAAINENRNVTLVNINSDDNVIIGTSNTDYRFTATVTPTTAIDSTLIWSSSNEDVAVIDSDGFVTPVAPGKTTITVQAAYPYSTAKDSVTLEVKDVGAAESISAKDITVYETEGVYINPVAYPLNSLQTFTFSSSDKNVATVDENGKVVGVNQGQTTITITHASETSISKQINVTVNDSRYLLSGSYLHRDPQLGPIDYSHMNDEEDPYIDLNANPSLGWQLSGAQIKDVKGTKWYTEASFKNIDVLNADSYPKLMIGSLTEDGRQGTHFFFDTVGGIVPLWGWKDLGTGDRVDGSDLNWTLNMAGKHPKAVTIPGVYEAYIAEGNTEMVEQLTLTTSKLGLLRDGTTYYYFVDGVCIAKREYTAIEATTVTVPVIFGFNLSFEIHNLNTVTDEATLNTMIGSVASDVTIL